MPAAQVNFNVSNVNWWKIFLSSCLPCQMRITLTSWLCRAPVRRGTLKPRVWRRETPGSRPSRARSWPACSCARAAKTRQEWTQDGDNLNDKWLLWTVSRLMLPQSCHFDTALLVLCGLKCSFLRGVIHLRLYLCRSGAVAQYWYPYWHEITSVCPSALYRTIL